MADVRDEVTWSLDSDRGFSVSCYAHFSSFRLSFGPPNRCDVALGIVWNLLIPFKVKAFGLRLFVDRLPSNDLLIVRGINFPLDNIKCVFCDIHLKNRNHSFLNCFAIKKVWKEIASWVSFSNIEEDECLPHFMAWCSIFRVKKLKECKLGVFWLATCWVIWLTRNEICFRNEGWSINNIVWIIKILVWRWSFYGEITHPNCCLNDFLQRPDDFFIVDQISL